MVKRVTVIENILSANDQIAATNRKLFDDAKVYTINIMASPGAGKTSLIEQTIRNLGDKFNLGVIDGDIASNLDAERAAAAGATAVQVNTGGECHLDALMIHNALTSIELHQVDFLIIENVGNLVCPVSFKLGNHTNVLVASIPEGDDKPYKYPGIYQGVDVLIVNKIDLLPYIPFKIDFFLKGVSALNPELKIFMISCQTGEGLDDWFDWITQQIESYRKQEQPS